MKKNKLIVITYIMVSAGLFVLAIDMWICGGKAFCRQSNSLSAKIANAAITINNPLIDSTTNWSGPKNLEFSIQFDGSNSSLTIPNVYSGGDDGDAGGGDGH